MLHVLDMEVCAGADIKRDGNHLPSRYLTCDFELWLIAVSVYL